MLSPFAGAAIGPCIVGLIVDRGWIYIFIMLISFLAASALVSLFQSSLFFLPPLSIDQPDVVSICTCDGIHPGRVEPASPRHGDVSWLGGMSRPPVPEVDAFIGFAAKAKLVRFVSVRPPLW